MASLTLDEGTLMYWDGQDPIWQIDIRTLALIGEYTTPHGPADDWFLIFWTLEDARLMKAEITVPTDAESVLAALSVVIGTEIFLGLASHTDLYSRVMWTPSLMDKALFSFPRSRSRNFLEKLKIALLNTRDLQLTDDVLAYLKSLAPDA